MPKEADRKKIPIEVTVQVYQILKCDASQKRVTYAARRTDDCLKKDDRKSPVEDTVQMS